MWFWRIMTVSQNPLLIFCVLKMPPDTVKWLTRQGCYQTITQFLCQMGLLDELGTPEVWTLDGSKVFFSLNVCITCFLCPLKRQWYLGFLSDPDGKLLLKGVVIRLSKICFLLRKDHLALAFGAGCSWRFLIQGLNFCKEWITRSQKNDAKSI